jgi:hypothetical protein
MLAGGGAGLPMICTPVMDGGAQTQFLLFGIPMRLALTIVTTGHAPLSEGSTFV